MFPSLPFSAWVTGMLHAWLLHRCWDPNSGLHACAPSIFATESPPGQECATGWRLLSVTLHRCPYLSNRWSQPDISLTAEACLILSTKHSNLESPDVGNQNRESRKQPVWGCGKSLVSPRLPSRQTTSWWFGFDFFKLSVRSPLLCHFPLQLTLKHFKDYRRLERII